MLGAVFVVVGYLIGEFDPKADAKDGVFDKFDHIWCKSIAEGELGKPTYKIFLQVGYEPNPCEDIEIHNFEGNKKKAEERLNELAEQANSIVRS